LSNAGHGYLQYVELGFEISFRNIFLSTFLERKLNRGKKKRESVAFLIHGDSKIYYKKFIFTLNIRVLKEKLKEKFYIHVFNFALNKDCD